MSFAKVKNEPNDVGRGGDQTAASRGGPVVHVRGDSETELDLLFSVLKNDSKQPGQTFRDKNLPRSFFNPPEPKPGGSHSREGSLDFTGASSGVGLQGHQQLQATAGGSNVFHARSHSSPAKLPVSLSLPNPQHAKQGSGDLMGDLQVPKYFVSNPSNAWPQEQCKPHEVSMVGGGQSNKQVNGGVGGGSGQAGIGQQQTGDGSAANVGPLPPGWEQGVTAEGDIYYINHNNKTTSWYDPRLPRHLQKPGAIKVIPGQAQQPGAQHGPLSQLSQSNPMANQQVQPAAVQQQQAGHIAKQQQQQQQQQQQFLQQQQQQQNQLLMKQLPTSVQIRASSGAMLSPMNQQPQQQQQQQQPMRVMSVTDQIRIELQKLHKDRERLAREQEDNNRREQMLIKELMTQQMLQSGAGQGDSLSGLLPSNLMVPQAMQQQLNISGVDPFLGQTVVGPDMHARQNSGDSGLGNCYSLPRTPEDFLGNVDALDRHDLNSLQKKQQQQQQHLAHQKQQICDFGMNQRPGSLGALDMASLNDPSSVEPMSMDSDELVSTLTDDLELGRDFLDMQMMDILL